MSPQELKDMAKDTKVLDMELYIKDSNYRHAMEDENPWIQSALQIERKNIIGTILASSSVALTGQQQKMLEDGYARFLMAANSNLQKSYEGASKEKLLHEQAGMLDILKVGLNREPREIEEDDRRLEEFLDSSDSEGEIEKFSRTKELRFDTFNSDRLYRLLMRKYNPHFQEISSRERMYTTAKALEWARPLGLTAEQIEAIAAMVPEGGKELLEGTAAGVNLKEKHAAGIAGKKREGRVMAALEELKKKYLGGGITFRKFSEEVASKMGQILQAELPETSLPSKLREEYVELQKRLDAKEISEEEFLQALDKLMDSHLPGKSGKEQRVV